MKPEPLDLEEIRERWIDFDSSLSDTIGEFVEESGFLTLLDEDSEEFKERDKMIKEIRELIDDKLNELFEELNQSIKSAINGLLQEIEQQKGLIKVCDVCKQPNKINNVITVDTLKDLIKKWFVPEGAW